MTRNLVETLDTILARLTFVIQQNNDDIELPALKELEGSMKQRIHNKGQDSDGKRIGLNSKRKGLYTKSYEKKKRDGGIIGGRIYAGSGGNLYPINLQLHGDLLKDFTVGISRGRNVLQFQTSIATKKAERHEKSYNTAIYKPSEDELEGFKDVLVISVGEVLKKNFRI
jgi:hypothetical protein